ncbi:MAG TPA: hypothetical protein VNT92_03910 [Acidimicrobiia bacterium]|nr:hypothetical protein [Acidimicrobiia bacterium]
MGQPKNDKPLYGPLWTTAAIVLGFLMVGVNTLELFDPKSRGWGSALAVVSISVGLYIFIRGVGEWRRLRAANARIAAGEVSGRHEAAG